MKEKLIAIGVSLVALLAPIHSILISVGVMIVVDLVTGILAARKRKEPVTSAALRRTVSKMLIYQVAIISGFILETYLMAEVIPVSKLVASAIGLTEFKSIIENLTTLNNGETVFKDLLARLGSKNDK